MGDRAIINHEFADFKVDFYFVSLFIKKTLQLWTAQKLLRW